MCRILMILKYLSGNVWTENVVKRAFLITSAIPRNDKKWLSIVCRLYGCQKYDKRVWRERLKHNSLSKTLYPFIVFHAAQCQYLYVLESAAAMWWFHNPSYFMKSPTTTHFRNYHNILSLEHFLLDCKRDKSCHHWYIVPPSIHVFFN